MSTVSTFESGVDRCISLLADRICEISDSGSGQNEAGETTRMLINMSAWLEYFALDALGELNFSRPLGFMSRGEDVGGWIGGIEAVMNYVSLVSRVTLYPWNLYHHPDS